MGRASKSERLTSIRPIVMPTTITFSKLTLKKMYAKSRRLRIAQWNDALDYAEFIHALWNTMLNHDELKNDAIQLQEMLGKGDAIQLLSDTVLEHRRLVNQ